MTLESTEATQDTTTSTEATRDDLIAAVKAAGGTESVDVAAEEQAAAQTSGAAAAEQVQETEEQRLDRILKAREERRSKTLDADEYAARVKAEAEAEKQRLIEEARAQARKEAEAERQRLIDEFKSNPTAHMRALAQAAGGVEKLVDMVNREGSPEWSELQKTQAELQKTRELAGEGKAAKDEIAQLRAEIQAEKQALERAKVQNEYLSQFASAEKAPHMHARWDAEEIFEKSVALTHQWVKEGLQYRKDFDDADVAAYLEKQSRERYEAKLKGTSPAQQVSAGASEGKPGLAPKALANGTRTLSVAQGSERRTSPRPFKELTPEQQREELIREVEAARRMNPDATG